ncbi:terminal repeat-encoded protein [Staphylococcus phage vB_SauM_JDYN]|nr:terminal repeat-encoded protein [Staphylococcus phage vB_SauM_JDYN]
MNRLQEFLQEQGTSTVKDVATHGVQSGAIGELIYTADVVDFFNRYYSEIEAVILEYAEELTHGQFYDLANSELMEELNEYTNLEFTTNDEMLELISEEAFKQAEEDNAEEWDNMDVHEIEEIVFDYMETLEVLPTEQDKVQFVYLAVEIVAQQMQEKE